MEDNFTLCVFVVQAKRVLSDSAFMRSLEEFEKDNIPDTVVHKLKKYIDDPQYQPDVVAKQSRAAMSLCMWTRAMDVYNRWAATAWLFIRWCSAWRQAVSLCALLLGLSCLFNAMCSTATCANVWALL